MPIESIDHASLLAHVTADMGLSALEGELRKSGYTLALERAPEDIALGTWLAEGAEGASSWWKDPVDQLVAGFEATLRDGRTFKVSPVPRRAVGPDLFAIVFGVEGALATLDRIWMRIHRAEVARPTTAAFVPPSAVLDRTESDVEARLWNAIGDALMGKDAQLSKR